MSDPGLDFKSLQGSPLPSLHLSPPAAADNPSSTKSPRQLHSKFLVTVHAVQRFFTSGFFWCPIILISFGTEVADS
ncbi:hypothetical protein GE061_009983 [Apolygus lucorum]|uniref:Uncharacterized protein n=1 Tax=Apolygus lucorum TaxID=248454 RepID=A0A8S9Y3V2_APOLU|nr:hypothetical protein GE061_009983 [Apolygus lucorum]